MRRHLPHSSVKNKKNVFDKSLFVSVLILTLFGLIMVYDSSTVQAYASFGDKYVYIRQQLLWVAMGFGALGFFSLFDYHNLQKIALPFFVFAFFLLLTRIIFQMALMGYQPDCFSYASLRFLYWLIPYLI